MLDTLKQTGKKIGHEIGRAWESLSEGWRDMFVHSGEALTQFVHKESKLANHGDSPRWALLAGEVEETDEYFFIRVELPGIRKEDCQIKIENKLLHLSGEKYAERSSDSSTYHVTERAYGSFQRTVALPHDVAADQAEAIFENGVLTVRLPKIDDDRSCNIPVS